MKNNTIVIYSNKDTDGKHDATGAFIPEAKAFAEHHGIPEENIRGIPCVRVKAFRRRELVLEFIRKKRSYPIDTIAWFGHGYSTGIQFGFTNKNVDKLVRELTGVCSTNLKQVLYACSTASTSKNTRNIKMPGTDGGFADTLRDEMYKQGFRDGWIDAHLVPGHTTRNPYIVRFLCTEERVNQGGGIYLVHPNSSGWGIWEKGIRKTKLRFDFPYLEDMFRCEDC